MTQTAFLELLRGRWRDPARLLCVGLDPEPERLPHALRRLPLAEGVWGFCRGVIDIAGPDALNAAFEAPAQLPALAELADPAGWLRRVAGRGR